MTDKIKITVFRAGTHAGKRYTPGPDGHVLEVSPSQAKALRDRGADQPPTGITDNAPHAAPAATDVPPSAPAGAGVGAGNSVPEAPADKTPVASRTRG